MRSLAIKRDKSFFGAWVKYYCVLNLTKQELLKHVGLQETFTLGFQSQYLKKSSQVFAISSGQSISINIDDNKNTLFVVTFTMSGRIFSNEVTVNTKNPNPSYYIRTKSGILANKLILNEAPRR